MRDASLPPAPAPPPPRFVRAHGDSEASGTRLQLPGDTGPATPKPPAAPTPAGPPVTAEAQGEGAEKHLL